MELGIITALAAQIRENIARVIVGKEETVDLLIVALLCSGHVLLEDVPGTGKTLLAKTLARSLDCQFRRVQFTPDLLPSDLSGIHFYNQKEAAFEFRPGPLFTNILLADEINRATPRTQSSLLECMEERQITVDGVTHVLDRPFLVLATQNPVENQGTFPLPEAQLDRFFIKMPMGYPASEEGIAILRRFMQQSPAETLQPVATAAAVCAAQDLYTAVHVSDDLLRYIVKIAEQTRTENDVVLGVSPRGTQALLKAAQAYAALQGRAYVTPDDIKRMARPVLAHRLVLTSQARARRDSPYRILDRILETVPVPTEAMDGVTA